MSTRSPAPLRRLVLSAVFLGPSLAVPQDAPPLLDRARQAVGSPGNAATVFVGRGRGHAMGVDGTLTLTLSPTGPFHMELESPLPERSTFDGTTLWIHDYTGIARAAELEDADRRKLFAWVLSGAWLATPALAVVAPQTASSTGASTLTLHLAGTPMEMQLELDPATALPRELVYLAESGRTSWTFADYREVGGRRLAHRWTHDEGAGLKSFQVDAFRSEPATPDAFRPPRAPESGATFDPEADPELEVKRLGSGHLLVEPLLEGESLGAFVFDTGAGALVIDKHVADELGLESLGMTVAVGVAGKTTSAFRRGERFELGPFVLHDPLYSELDLGFLQSAFGRRIAGIVGYDLLARSVVELEQATPRIVLHDPERFELAGGSWQDLVLQGNTPCVLARFEGERQGLFRLDTGAGGTVTFHAPAVEALDLLAGRALTRSASGGVGGTGAAPEGELAWFELGGQRFEKPRVSFSQAELGAFTDPYTTGNIGQGFLGRFRLVLDYPHDRLALLPLAK